MPKYNIRQYIDLAAFIAVDLPDAGLWKASKRRVAERLADRLVADNPAFDRVKFLAACGLEDDHA